MDQDPGYAETAAAATRSCQLRRSAPGQARLEDSLCDLSCDSLDLDSVSQVSLAESSPGPEDRERMFKCVSSENINRTGIIFPHTQGHSLLSDGYLG